MQTFNLRALILVLASWLSVPPAALAQATVRQAADGFVAGVTLCTRSALKGEMISELPETVRAEWVEADAGFREFARVPAGRPAWETATARGVVLVHEPADGTCSVMVYGPPIRPLFAQTALALTGSSVGLNQTNDEETAADIVREFEGTGEAGPVRVILVGGEPGMEGRRFRFPLATASISWTP